jgi:Kdo2-lipid IVA lauroyltransferase/acyltransferase
MTHRLTPALFIDYFVFLLVRLTEEIVNIVPDRVAMAAGRFVGRILYVVLPDRRRAAEENLTIAFGSEKPREWIVKTARANFENLGMMAMEFFRIRRWTHKDIAEKVVLVGQLPYNLMTTQGNHGICILYSHFGSFEVGAVLAKWLGWKVHLIVTPLKNPFLSRYFFSRGGEGTGIRTYPHKGIVEEMIRLLQSGEMVAFLGDQRGDAERGIFVNFFGKPAPANEVFARIAIEGKARVMPLCTYRRDDGLYQSVFGEEVLIETTGDRKKDLTNVSQLFHDRFEEWLRMKPEQGFWLQRKWRRKPSRRRRAPSTGRTADTESSSREGKTL